MGIRHAVTSTVLVALVSGCGARQSSSPVAGIPRIGDQADSGTSNSQPYTVVPSASTGVTPDGRGTWTLNVKTVSGGDSAVAGTFNSAVQAAAQSQLENTRKQAAPDATWNLETTPDVFFSSASVSELISGVYYAQQTHARQAAHPIDTYTTVVIDSRSASPITFTDLFTDEQKGLERLSRQTRQLLPGVLGSGSAPMADEPGNAALAENFANWIPTPEGLRIHFDDGQFAQGAPPHGIPTLTIPWSALDDLLAPGMAALRQP